MCPACRKGQFTVYSIPVLSGVINLDKPSRMSSALAVTRVKYMLERGVKIGHAGTLDPFATGVLVILIGRATRQAEWFMSQPKQYRATVKLGATTATLDPESPEILSEGVAPVSRAAIEHAVPAFAGNILQRPPAYSALKIEGRPAYQLARRGMMPDLEPRPVQVYGIEILGYDWPLLDLRVDCGRGTYIRSLARDLGEALAVGGYLTSLRRTRVGPCLAEEAVTLETLRRDGVAAHLRSWPA